MVIPQEAKKEEQAFPLVYTHPQAQTSQETYPTMIPQSEGFPFTYPTTLVVQMLNVGQQAGANMMDLLIVSNLDDPNEQEKLMMILSNKLIIRPS